MDLSLFTRINAGTVVVGSNLALSVRYFHAVRVYTGRTLSFPSDILNAFAGVLQWQSNAFNTQTYYGLPTCFFDLALLWQPTAQLERRPGFPSWSWAGWTGEVRWLGDTLELASDGLFATRSQELKNISEWHVKQTWITWRKRSGDLIWQPPNDNDDPNAEKDIGYRPMYYTPENPYGRSREEDINGVSSNKALSMQQLMQVNTSFKADGLLQIQTLTAQFRIRPSGTYLKYGSLDPNWEPHGRLIFHMLNRREEIAGYVLLDENWQKTYSLSPDTEHEFIMLSDANYECQWGRPHEGHPYTKFPAGTPYIEYHAMMVTATSEGIAERAGLGRVHQEALKDAWGKGPVWKDIVLG